MLNEVLLDLYRLYIADGARRIDFVEGLVGAGSDRKILIDERRNQKDLYISLFSIENMEDLEKLYSDMMMGMKGARYQQCEDILMALEFLQQISATAMWKYNQNASALIEDFVRDFDRLDVSAERYRLFELAQK